MSNKPIPNLKPLIYTTIYPELVKIAKDNGYALAVHGSLMSDMDLIACAWVDDAVEPDDLVHRFALYISSLDFSNLREYKFEKTVKCHGRIAYTIPINSEPNLYIDLSVYY